MSDPPPIESARLRLDSLSIEFLQFMEAGDLAQARASVDYAIPDGCALFKRAWLARRIRMIEEDPLQHPWLNRAIVRKEDNQMVGNICFHHKAPDPHLLDYTEFGAELGYTIEEPHRRMGYATESATAMMQWANREHGVRTFIVSISPHNAPSLGLAESMNFRKVGEHIDEVDGLEWVMQTEFDKSRELTQTARG